MDRKDVLAGAKRIAASLEGPFGQRKLQPVIAEHLDYFKKARASGAVWPQIAEVLARAGVCSPEGKPYRANILRAMVSRAERASDDSAMQRHTSSKVGKRKFDSTLAVGRGSKASTSKPKPVSFEPPSNTLLPSGKFEEVRNRIARASQLRGLNRDGR